MLGVCYYPEHWPEDWWAKTLPACATWAYHTSALANSHGPDTNQNGGNTTGLAGPCHGCAGEAGLKVVLGTPTAAPPKWLMDEFPDIAPV